jgi:hypothetical protein
LHEAAVLYDADAKKFLAGMDAFGQKYAQALPAENIAQLGRDLLTNLEALP